MSANSKTLDDVKLLLRTCQGFNSEQISNFYDSWAPTYEQDIGIIKYRSHNLAVDCLHANFSGNPEELQVLDVACGSGCVAELMVELGFKYFVGVDGSKGMLEQAARSGLYQDLKQALLGVEPLPAETGSFDVVILAGGLGEGFVPVSVVRELCDAAKPGGLICMSRGFHSSPVSTYTKDLNRELKLMEEEGLWSLVATQETERYMVDVNTNKDGEQFIRGTVHLFKKSIQ